MLMVVESRAGSRPQYQATARTAANRGALGSRSTNTLAACSSTSTVVGTITASPWDHGGSWRMSRFACGTIVLSDISLHIYTVSAADGRTNSDLVMTRRD